MEEHVWLNRLYIQMKEGMSVTVLLLDIFKCIHKSIPRYIHKYIQMIFTNLFQSQTDIYIYIFTRRYVCDCTTTTPGSGLTAGPDCAFAGVKPKSKILDSNYIQIQLVVGLERPR